MFACFNDLEDESLDYSSVSDLPVWWGDDFRFSSNSEESPLHKLALSAVQAAHRRLDASEEGALFPAQTSDRRRVTRTDRMCELEWILLSHDKLKLRKNGLMESGSGLRHMYRSLSDGKTSLSHPTPIARALCHDRNRESAKCVWVVEYVAARRFSSRRVTNLDKALLDVLSQHSE